MTWEEGKIDGVHIRGLKAYSDERGWLAEIFRRDELESPLLPAMAYISVTDPGVTRGPHEHMDQTDMFAFFHGRYALYMWDPRTDSPSRGRRTVQSVGIENPCVVVIPPGVVHAYRNEGTEPAYVLNLPNRLYAGPGKSEPVDEIRHEDLKDSPYVVD